MSGQIILPAYTGPIKGYGYNEASVTTYQGSTLYRGSIVFDAAAGVYKMIIPNVWKKNYNTNFYSEEWSSPDGLNWSVSFSQSSTSNAPASNAYNNGTYRRFSTAAYNSQVYALVANTYIGGDKYIAIGQTYGTTTYHLCFFLDYSSGTLVTTNSSISDNVIFESVHSEGNTVIATGNLESLKSGTHISTDLGQSWSAKNSTVYGSKVTYGNNKWVIGRSNGTIYYSSDGINWTSVTVPNCDDASSITFGDGMFVINSRNYINYSTDAINWSSINIPNSRYKSMGHYGDGKFIFASWDKTTAQTLTLTSILTI